MYLGVAGGVPWEEGGVDGGCMDLTLAALFGQGQLSRRRRGQAAPGTRAGGARRGGDSLSWVQVPRALTRRATRRYRYRNGRRYRFHRAPGRR